MCSYVENTKPTYEDGVFVQKEQHVEGAALSLPGADVFAVTFAPPFRPSVKMVVCPCGRAGQSRREVTVKPARRMTLGRPGLLGVVSEHRSPAAVPGLEDIRGGSKPCIGSSYSKAFLFSPRKLIKIRK